MNEESHPQRLVGLRRRPADRRRRPQHHLRHRRDRRLEVLHRQRHLHHQRPPHLGLDHPDPRRARAGRGLLAVRRRRVRPLVRHLHRRAERDRARCSRSRPTRSGRWRSSPSRSSSSTSWPRGPKARLLRRPFHPRRQKAPAPGPSSAGSRPAPARPPAPGRRRRPRRRLGPVARRRPRRCRRAVLPAAAALAEDDPEEADPEGDDRQPEADQAAQRAPERQPSPSTSSLMPTKRMPGVCPASDQKPTR